jgi:hypothetical protein
MEWTAIQQQHLKKDNKAAAPLPSPADGLVLHVTGINKGMDKFGKLNIECSDAKQVLELRAKFPHLKIPFKTMYGYGGQKNYATVSLGYSKSDQSLLNRINSLVGTECSVQVVVEKYSTPKYGQGVFFVLTEIKGLEIPLL